MALSDDIEIALKRVPETRQDPSIAVSSALAGGNVRQNAEVTAQLLNTQATQKAVDNVASKGGGRGLFGATLGWLGSGVKGAMDLVGDGIGNTLKYANKPLEQVQQEYRYIRDVIERHGWAEGILASLPMAAGAVVGGVLTGGTGTAFGASLGQAIGGFISEETGILAHKDSWERVQKGEEYLDSSGQHVSPGRDAARFLGALTKHVGVNIEQHEGFDLYDAVSAIGDGLFSVAADPLTAAGGLSKISKTTGFAKGPLAAYRGGTVLDKGTDIARVTAQYPQVRRALGDLAQMDAATIIARHKKLAPFAKELGEADTIEKVGQVLVDNANAAQMRLRYLPRQRVANAPFASLVQSFQERASDASLLAAPEDAGRIGTAITGAKRRAGETYKRVTQFVPTSYNETTQMLSRETLYFNDPNSARTIYDMAKWGHSEGTARAVAADWATGDVNRRMRIFRNVITDNMANRMDAVKPGWAQTPEGSEIIARLGDQVDVALGGIDSGKTTAWGYDAKGRVISKRPTKGGVTESIPILENQHYNVPMPDYMTFDQNLKALGNGSEFFGKADDFLYRNFTRNVFKRYALLSGGFALRNSAADAIPFIARDPKKFARGKIAAMMVKHGWTVEKGEEDHMLAVIGRVLSKRVDLTDEQIEFIVDSTKVLDGHTVAPAIRAGHESGVEIAGVEQFVEDTLYSVQREVPIHQRVHGEDQAWAPDHDAYHEFWHKQAKDIAEGSPASRAAAEAFRASLLEDIGFIPTARQLNVPGSFEAGSDAVDKALKQASHKASLAAKRVLDETPEEILNQHKRHFESAFRDDQVVGATVASDKRKWIPGKKGEPGRYVATGEERLIGQQTVQKPLSYVESGAEPAAFRGGTTYGEINGPFGATRPVEKFVPGTPDIPATTQQMLGPEYGPQFVEQAPLSLLDDDPHMEWAQVIVENLKGTVMGTDGTIHDDLLAAIGRGEAFDMNAMKAIPVESRPAKIMGAYEKPVAPKRFADNIFAKLNTFMNWSAREPIYLSAQLDELDRFRPLIEAGEMTMEEAIPIIQTRAVNAVLPHIDNSMERTLMAEHARNWIPFYAAQQQAYARMGRLLAEDPLAFRRVQLGFTQMANFGGVYDDEGNNSHFVVPGVGWLTGGATQALGALGIPVVGSMPTAFSGNLRSLASVSPIMEGGEFFKPGPLVALGVRAMNNLLPETTSLTDPLMGDMAHYNSMWEMLIPNATARNLFNAFAVDDNRTMVKSTLDAVQALEYKQNVEMKKWVASGKDPEDPGAPHYVPGPGATDMERWEFIDRVKNHSRILSIFKAFIGSVSPIAPSVALGDVGLKDELYGAIKEKGITVAIQEFLKDNPDATPYAVFQTESGTPSPIDSTHQAQQWVESNIGFIKDKRYSQAASYFIPQSDDKFNQDVYNEQMAMGLRRKKSPEQLIRDIQVFNGNRWYWDTYKPARDAAEAKAKSPSERRRIAEAFNKTGDPANGVVPMDMMKAQNPIWYTNFSSGGRDAERALALAQMKDAIGSGAAPNSPMTDKLKGLLQDLESHQAAMLPGRNDSFAAQARREEKAKWQAYLKRTADTEPELAMAINNIFRGA